MDSSGDPEETLVLKFFFSTGHCHCQFCVNCLATSLVSTKRWLLLHVAFVIMTIVNCFQIFRDRV